MSPEPKTPPVIDYRCKICLNDYSDVAKYNKHIDSFKTLTTYADHLSDRPKKRAARSERPEERQVTESD